MTGHLHLGCDESSYVLTDSGREELAKLAGEFRAWLTRELTDWDTDGDQQFQEALAGLARRMVDDEPDIPGSHWPDGRN